MCAAPLLYCLNVNVADLDEWTSGRDDFQVTWEVV
jgi:hypothetical protein